MNHNSKPGQHRYKRGAAFFPAARASDLLQSLNQYADNNMRVLNWQEAAHAEQGQYGLLSLLAIALLDLGLIQINT